MSITKDDVLTALSGVRAPDGSPLAESASVVVCDGHVGVTLRIPADADLQSVLTQAVEGAVRYHAAEHALRLSSLRVRFADGASTKAAPPPKAGAPGAPRQSPSRPQDQAKALPGVGHVVAIGAGKGGVGKSTVAVNLAVGLARKGYAVGLLDGDIYGPSLPTMLGLAAHEPNALGGMIQPFAVHGIKAMTIGKLVDPEQALIWRGPMAHSAFKQLAEQTQWGELDYLIIDLPPGTGDVPLTMSQVLKLTGAVVVCTPQRVAQDDAVRAVRMFEQLGIEMVGIIENMSYFVGDDGKEYDIFGRGGAEQMAQRLGVPFLGSVPITMALRENCDTGDPTANFAEGTQLARDLSTLAHNFEAQVAVAAMRTARSTPTLSIS